MNLGKMDPAGQKLLRLTDSVIFYFSACAFGILSKTFFPWSPRRAPDSSYVGVASCRTSMPLDTAPFP